jgi:hypothetical protein
VLLLQLNDTFTVQANVVVVARKNPTTSHNRAVVVVFLLSFIIAFATKE